MPQKRPSYIIAITGASGAIYGVRLLEYMVKNGHVIHLTVTREGWYILNEEAGFSWEGNEKEIASAISKYYGTSTENLHYYNEDNLSASIASGSVHIDGMIVVPCSMKVVASVACGFASNLVERAADVTLKEKRRLIIVPRETPLNSIHLRNLLTLSEMGVHVIPAMPAFYGRPETIADIVDFIVGRILDSLHIDNDFYKRWNK
ncbi:MAG: aromatic acid decarboxylase [Nitrospirae bacterium RIFCSPHIGHO2_02_FULL_42_12]|nr:MAG: aromatic acid decarboxylase [Nitrospirae bacterium RIFCSPHIGHO2_02_FULL_42_12]